MIESLSDQPIQLDTPNILNQDSFQSHFQKFNHLPWLQSLKQRSWLQFQQSPYPSPSDERWRFSSPTNNLNLDRFHLSPAPSYHQQLDFVKHSNLVHTFSSRLVFEDNHQIHHDFIDQDLIDQGVIVSSIQNAFVDCPELLQTHLEKFASTQLGSEKFAHLNLAYAHSGSFIYIPSNIIVKHPIIVYHWANAPHSALFPLTLVILEPGASCKLIEVYNSSQNTTPSLMIANSNAIVGENAYFFRKTLQNLSPSSINFQLETTFVEQNCTTKAISVQLGSERTRHEHQLFIEGPNSHSKLYSLSVANNNQEVDQRSFQSHLAPNATSDLLYKNALLDSAKSIFSGMILVDPQAQQTDAYQTNRNLLLSDNAEANSLPGLEINANNVKCSHGSTSGKIDPADLFYIMSRGIPLDAAFQLLVSGFISEILSLIDDDELLNATLHIIQSKFSSPHNNLS